MKSLCLFASYYTSSNIPDYIKIYLKELRKHFSSVILIASKELNVRDAEFLQLFSIQFQLEKNEGFDFGMWYKSFQKTNVNEFDQIALVNDSCVLFRSLDPFMNWSAKSDADVKGMTFSEAITPHIQSYFMILNRKAISLAINYFNEHKIQESIQDVIKVYEIGLNKYFTENGIKLASFVDNDGYKGEFSPYYKCIDHHLQSGMPLIKTKVLFASYRKDELPNIARMGLNINVHYYYKIISQFNDLLINPLEFKQRNPPKMSSADILSYNFIKALIKFVRPAYKSVKK